MCIEDLSKFLRKKYVGKTTTYSNTYNCDNCLRGYRSISVLEDHKRLCYVNECQRVKLPKKGDILEFTKFERKTLCPLMMFVDFEASLSPPENECTKCFGEDRNCENTHKTKLMHEQKPIAYSMIVVDQHSKVIYASTKVSENCMNDFFDELFELEKDLIPILRKTVPVRMTRKNNQDFAKATHCHICEEKLNEDVVLDHLHYDGSYLGKFAVLCSKT